jgi:hypothetical protein
MIKINIMMNDNPFRDISHRFVIFPKNRNGMRVIRKKSNGTIVEKVNATME